MASVKDSNTYVEFDEFVDYQLGKTRDGVKWTDVFTAIVGAAVLVLGYLLLFVLADHWFFDGGVPRSVRIAAFAVVLVLACVWIVVKGIWPFFRRVSDLYAARMLEGAEPSLRGHLLGLIDSRRAGRVPSEEIRRVLEKRSATTLSSVDVDAALDRGNLMRVSYTLLGVVLAMCAYVIFSPKDIGPSIVRAMIPGSSVGVATRTEILEVKPQDTTILAGERLDVSVRIRGERPDKVWLFYSTRDRRFVNEPLELRLVDEPTRRYATTLIGDGTRGLRQDLTYHITAGDAQTQTFTVHVGQPPSATIESIALEPPAYTKRPPQTLPGPPIEALEGTRVTLNARANRPLEAATLQLADSSDFQRVTREMPLTLSDDGMTASGEWTLKLRDDKSSPKFFRIDCRDLDGSPNPNPIVYPITIHADQRPKITLHDPKSDLERPANAVVPLLISAMDPDFELREITLHIAKGNEDLPGRTVVWEGEAPSASLRHEWKLEELALKPGDTLTYYLQARDNREPSAGRRNSPKLNIRITEAISPEEAQKQLAEDIKRQEEAQAAAPQEPGGVGEPPPPEPAENTPPKDQAQQDAGGASQQPQSSENQSAENKTGQQDQPADRQQQEPSEPVKNDGSADDEAIRKILEHQRQQNGGQPEGQQQPNGKGGQNAGEKQGGSNQGESSSEGQSSSEGESAAGGKRSGKDGANSRPGDANGEPSSENGAMPSDGPTGKPGSPDPSAQPADQGAADSNPTPQDPGQASDGQGTDGQVTDGQTTGGETAGQDSTGQTPDGTEQGDGETGDGETGDGMNSLADGAASDGQPAPKPGEDGAQPDNNDATPSDAPNASAGEPAGAQHPPGDQSEGAGGTGADGQKGEDPAGGQGSDPTSSDQKPGPPESSGTGADPSNPNGEMQPATGESTGEAQQPVREQSPTGDNPNPGEGTEDQSSQRPAAGEEGAGAPNSTGQTDDATGDSTKSSGQGPGNTPDPTDQSNEASGQSGEGETARQPTETGQSQGAGSGEKSSQSEQTPSQDGSSGSQPQGSGQPSESGGEQSNGGQSGQQPSGKGQSDMGQSGQGQAGEGQSGQGQSGQGQSGQGQSGQGQSGQGSGSSGQSGSPGSAGGSGSNPTGGGGSGPGGSAGTAPSQDEPPPSAPNEPNDDHAREAANLVLKRLDESLDRGEVDPELLKELGWTEDDVRKFADRMRSNLSPPTGEESARERAHRLEFEHMLENMSFQAEGDIREGGTGRVERVEGVGTVKPAVPTEYRDAYDRFTRSVSGLEGADQSP